MWADKNLKSHGLIQAYSRTNRILNSVKTYGNIVSFRNLEQETNDALALFGNKDAKGIVLLKPYAEYYAEYEQRIAELVQGFPLGYAIVGEAAQKAFIKLFGSILRLKNILTAFDDFTGNEILSQREFQDYQSLYLNLYAEFRSTSDAEKESINDDVVFEIELIKQVEINVDYILLLVEQYLKKKGGEEGRGSGAHHRRGKPQCRCHAQLYRQRFPRWRHCNHRYGHHENPATGVEVFKNQWARVQEADSAGQAIRLFRALLRPGLIRSWSVLFP